MQSIPTSKYINFGTGFRYLLDSSTGWPVHGESFILGNINYFLASLSGFELPVTERAADELRKFGEELAKTDSDHKLTAGEANNLKKIMRDLRKTLFAELKGKVAFIVTDKRIDVNKLLSAVSTLMAPGVFDLLPEIARYDFAEAGKCIAFERPTAAAFHLLRGTEAVLRDFYCSI